MNAEAAKIVVPIAAIAVGRHGETLWAQALGSCVALCLYDPLARVGGLAHVFLPKRRGADEASGRYADSAVPALLAEIVALGAKRERVTASLAGGARMFTRGLAAASGEIGALNARAVLDALDEAGIPVLKSDLGGERARTVCFSLTDGAMEVRVRA